MQTVDEQYARMWRSYNAAREHKAVIYGISYDESMIVGTPIVTRSLFSKEGPGVGGVTAGQLDLAILPQGDIPRMARIELYTRLVWSGEEPVYSQWIPKGIFFIGTRNLETETGVLTIHAYDALKKGDQKFLQEGDPGEWPRAASVIVGEICTLLDVELDDRTELDDSIKVPYPNDWTCREILSMVGTAHCGNWTMTDEGKLRLIPLWSIPEATHYLVDQYGDPITLGGVKILVE